MAKLLQILLLLIAVQFGAYGRPLFQGISFKRGFEINFKPFQRKPISFVKEIWSPFGIFGRKHSITRRHSSESVPIGPVIPVSETEPRPGAPVFEHVEEIKPVETLPLTVLPPQTPRTITPIPTVTPVLVSSVPPPVVSPETIPVPSPVPTVVITPAPLPITPAYEPVISEVPLDPVKRKEVPPPISTNFVIPPPTRVGPPPAGLYTDITRPVAVRESAEVFQPIAPPLAEVEKVAPSVETNSINPVTPTAEGVIKENSFIRGSKLALYFGNIFLQLMSQFLTNARATFDQMTNPPPVFNN